jgi:hypothetical protein
MPTDPVAGTSRQMVGNSTVQGSRTSRTVPPPLQKWAGASRWVPEWVLMETMVDVDADSLSVWTSLNSMGGVPGKRGMSLRMG